MWNLSVICNRNLVLNAFCEDPEMLKLVAAMYKARYKNSIYSHVEEESKTNYVVLTFSSDFENLRQAGEL